jgi:cytochrome c
MNKTTASRIAAAALSLISLTSGPVSDAAAPTVDPKRGELLFQTCAACHSVLGDGIAPDLTGIYGKKAAVRSDFAYSSALKNSGVVWDDATLRAFIKDPQATIRGTTMTFPGYATPADIDAVIAYLKSLK